MLIPMYRSGGSELRIWREEATLISTGSQNSFPPHLGAGCCDIHSFASPTFFNGNFIDTKTSLSKSKNRIRILRLLCFWSIVFSEKIPLLSPLDFSKRSVLHQGPVYFSKMELNGNNDLTVFRF